MSNQMGILSRSNKGKKEKKNSILILAVLLIWELNHALEKGKII